jgi:hypothetical protein
VLTQSDCEDLQAQVLLILRDRFYMSANRRSLLCGTFPPPLS